MDTNQVYAVLDQAKTAFEALSTTLREVIGQMKDLSEENIRLHDANTKLAEDYSTMRQRANDLENELFQSRREARDANSQAEAKSRAVDDLNRALSESQDECRKLREIILTVAASVDGIVNAKTEAKAPEVAPAAPKPEAVTEEAKPAQAGPGDYASRW